MKFTLDLTEDQLHDIELHMAVRSASVDGCPASVTFADRIFAMVLGAAVSAGWGKAKRKKETA